MTRQEREAVMEAVTEAVLQCQLLETLQVPVAQRCQMANLVRREVVRRLPAPEGSA